MCILAVYRHRHKQIQGLLHNMSAPPRLKITMKPIGINHTAWRDGCDVNVKSVGKRKVSPAGLKWIARIDLDQFIRGYFPAFDWPDEETRLIRQSVGLTGDTYTRIEYCLVIARVTCGVIPMATRDEVHSTAQRRMEDICEELNELCSRPELADKSLPFLGISAPADKADRPVETDPVRVLHILTHLNGNTFVRDGDVMVSGKLDNEIRLDLWVPS